MKNGLFILTTCLGGLLALAGCDQSSSMADKPRRTGSATQADARQETASNTETASSGDVVLEEGTPSEEAENQPSPASVPFAITSTAFQNNQMMPAQYVAKNGGGNQSPPLAWAGAPAETGSFAIQMVDLDFLNPSPSPFIHWVITDIPPATTTLPAGLPADAILAEPAGARQPRGAYRGPNPPNLHRYEFTIYAIKSGMTLTLGNDSVANRAELESKSVGKATIIGTYQ